MIVLVANYLPDAVRGKIKLWFLEPKPNVFVSGVKDSLAMKIVDMLLQHCGPEAGILIFQDSPKPPFVKIFSKGTTNKKITSITGMQLVVEK
ncbi:MAG: type I-E CRISPR-associated endoribonuclease Cas2e [Lentisphaeria bacterium]|nr:type I-E CRISPR-associated endoribonuclease Cas2e [Lentisphaeria bacterium]